MADIELVIKIEEETYNRIMNGWIPLHEAVNLIKNVQKGTPLPKGHGRLIDERQINECKQVGLNIRDGIVTRCLVTDAPTIIEAEKQSLKQIRRNKNDKR